MGVRMDEYFGGNNRLQTHPSRTVSLTLRSRDFEDAAGNKRTE